MSYLIGLSGSLAVPFSSKCFLLGSALLVLCCLALTFEQTHSESGVRGKGLGSWSQ